jgi:hypothetical protein
MATEDEPRNFLPSGKKYSFERIFVQTEASFQNNVDIRKN